MTIERKFEKLQEYINKYVDAYVQFEIEKNQISDLIEVVRNYMMFETCHTPPKKKPLFINIQ